MYKLLKARIIKMKILRALAIKAREKQKKVNGSFEFLGANGSVYTIKTYKDNGYNFTLFRFNELDNITQLVTVRHFIESKDQLEKIIMNHIAHITDIKRY